MFATLRALVVAFASAVGVVGPATSAHAEDRDISVALISGNTTDSFYMAMHEGAKKAADALGIELIYQGPRDWDAALQAPIIDALIARKPGALLIAPMDTQQLIASLKTAHDAGITVITVDTFIDDGSYQDGSGRGDFPVSYVASDNVLGGRIAARALAEAVDFKGAVYVASGKPHVSTTDQREEGFKLEMQNHPEIEVLETQFSEDNSTKAAAQLEAVLARRPDLAGVFGADFVTALGTADGVMAAGKSGQVKIVAFDAPQQVVNDIKNGLIDMAIAQHPAEIGYFGVVTAHAFLTGQSVPVLIGTGYTVMDASNIDDPDILKFVY